MAGLFAVLLGGNRRDGTLIGHGGAAGFIAVFMLPEKGKGARIGSIDWPRNGAWIKAAVNR